MFALHFVVRQRINSHLKDFKVGWNSHKLTSANSMSPNQIWIVGCHDLMSRAVLHDETDTWEPQSQVL